MPRTLDENGEVILDPRWPADVQVSDATLRRWQLCVGVAASITRQPVEHPETALFARVLYNDPDLPTDDPEITEGVFDEIEHPRGRSGEWIRKGKAIKLRGLGRGPMSPGIKSMRRTIRDLGLDHEPTPGPAARRILGDHANTCELWTAKRAAGPLDSPVHEPYKARRRVVHDRIVGAILSGIPDTPDKPLTGIASLLGENDPITQKLYQGGRLSEAEKERVREAAVHARRDTPPEVLFVAGGPASGKTTLLQNNPEIRPANSVEIDADEVKERLPEYQQLTAARDQYAAHAVHGESGDIAARIEHEATDLSLNQVIDGTGNQDPGVFKKQIDRKHARGYDVGVVYVNMPTEDAIDWSVDRAQRTLRWVPIPTVRDMHAKVSHNFNHEISKIPYLKSLDVFDSEAGHIATQTEDGEIIALGDPSRLQAFRDKEFERVE